MKIKTRFGTLRATGEIPLSATGQPLNPLPAYGVSGDGAYYLSLAPDGKVEVWTEVLFSADGEVYFRRLCNGEIV